MATPRLMDRTRPAIGHRLLPRFPDPDLYYGFLLLGVLTLLAIAVYKHDRNYWYDEAMYIQALRAQGWLPPGVPMSLYEQAAPYGAYLVDKAVLTVVGFQENLLRAPGMIAWLVTGLATWRAARIRLGPAASFVAAIVATTGGIAIIQAAEFKHYEFELAASAVIAWLTFSMLRPDAGRGRVTWFLIGSAASMLFSNTAVIVFGVTWTVALVTLMVRPAPDRRLMLRLAVGGVLVVAAFGAWYLLALRPAFRYQLAYPTYSVHPTVQSFTDLLSYVALPSGSFAPVFWTVVLLGAVLAAVVRRDVLVVFVVTAALITVAGIAAVTGFVPFVAARHVLFLVPFIGLAAGAAVTVLTSLPLPGLARGAFAASGVGVVALVGVWSLVPATQGNATYSNQAIGYAVTAFSDRCSGYWVDFWAQPAATLYAERAGLGSRLHGLVSPRSGAGQDAWAYRLQNDPGAWQARMVDWVRSNPRGCVLTGTQQWEGPLVLDPLQRAGLACTPMEPLPDTAVYRCAARAA